jgi:hypothetical protein
VPSGAVPRAARVKLPKDERVVAYLAGLFDGEGCVTRTNNKPIIQVGMTHTGGIDLLRRIGGTVRVEQPPGNRKLLHRWRLMAGADVEAFLRLIHPFLRVKQHDATEAIVEIEGWRLVRSGDA